MMEFSFDIIEDYLTEVSMALDYYLHARNYYLHIKNRLNSIIKANKTDISKITKEDIMNKVISIQNKRNSSLILSIESTMYAKKNESKMHARSFIYAIDMIGKILKEINKWD
jgi:hypothetical protein